MAAYRGSQLEQSVAVAFGDFEIIAEVQHLFLDHASVHVVYRDRQVFCQSFPFKRIERNGLECLVVFLLLDGSLDSIEEIAVAKNQEAYFGRQWNVDNLSLHRSCLFRGIVNAH